MRARSVPEIKMIGWGFLLNGFGNFCNLPSTPIMTGEQSISSGHDSIAPPETF
jgi:hypothetical protein